jgi:hypothetical protein
MIAAGPGAQGLGGPAASTGSMPAASASVELARYRRSGLDSTGVRVPFSYAFPPDPDRPLSLDGEVYYTDTESAASYGISLGLAYSFRQSERWYLIPALNYGVSGSDDLGSVGQIVSVSLTSAALLYDSPGASLWMGNAINHLRTLRSSIGSYSADPDLHNTAFVNGLVLTTPLPALGRGTWIEYSFADTRYTGTDLYDSRYDELGVAVARSRSGSGRYYKLGLSYLDTSNSKGWMLSFNYVF